MAYSTPL